MWCGRSLKTVTLYARIDSLTHAHWLILMQVLQRVRLKAATFGQEVVLGADDPSAAAASSGSGGGDGEGDGRPSYKVLPEVVAQLYEEWVMPLTKEVEVQYLLRRLDGADGALDQW